MKKKEFILFCIAVMMLGIFISIFSLKRDEILPTDMVSVNEIVKLTERNWGHITEGTYSGFTQTGKAKNINFTLIDMYGAVVYSSSNHLSFPYEEQINQAVKNRDTIVDIIVNGSLAGKLILNNNMYGLIVAERERQTRNILLCFLLMAVMLIGYFIYLQLNIFRPFYKLKQFAVRVAAGNLDTPVLMDKKNIFGAFTESFDLMREALNTARLNEYLANKSKKELVASLSHDIKNPVASIKAICETMALKSEDRHITTIRLKAEQIDTLISDMFQSTLEELGELKVNNEELNCEILLEMIESADYYHKAVLLNELPECLILCDKLRLTQIIDNVFNNSYKYADTDIHISFELKENYLLISMKDFGKGVSEEDILLIWEKFYRGKNTEGKDGAGLGLYLSKLFMEKMGGQIECMNVEDGFVITMEIRLAGNVIIHPLDIFQ